MKVATVREDLARDMLLVDVADEIAGSRYVAEAVIAGQIQYGDDGSLPDDPVLALTREEAEAIHAALGRAIETDLELRADPYLLEAYLHERKRVDDMIETLSALPYRS